MDPVARAICARNATGEPAIAAYVLGGLPTPEAFADILVAVSQEADVVEVGIPFTDPMADGVTLQEANVRALAAGATPTGILDTIRTVRPRLGCPVLVMSYLNPLLALGSTLADRLADAGVSGCIVPDLPLEESDLLGLPLSARGLGLVQLVAPTTPDARARRLATASSGFVYAVTANGTTGGTVGVDDGVARHLARLRGVGPPVLAGFGIRSATQVDALRDHCDGVVVGSALVRTLLEGGDVAATVRSLRPSRRAA